MIKTGIVTDKRFLEHKTGHIHPEHPGRLKAIYRMLKKDFPGRLIHITAEPAPLEYLEYVHTPIYIEKVLRTANHDFTSLAPDTPASAMTYLAAWVAAGACIKGLDSLISGQCDICFSLVRPPGHHALSDRAGGFCIFNNLGITAQYAIKCHGFKRILIIDWDIHHGNGLQEIFYKQKNVLYLSSHDTLLYPYTGNWEETGDGEGKGYTVNLPVPRDLDEKEFYYIYQETISCVIRQYKPDLIMISAGFDAHYKDPIGRSKMTEQFFFQLMNLIMGLRQEAGNLPVLLALEGGYHPQALAGCVKSTLMAALDFIPKQNTACPHTSRAEALVHKAREIHKPYNVWTN
ncbi:Histone deacetylase family protein [Desulfonema limicola]|uniref:Histone deacetylase family protein n=1 Tax=Desulfonema limicola TaxID=45656 RepID=A0A975BE33_9BACT|nr:histone deacetylase [Desulfonema limicola]QTA83628.1 Histone deacetylase family protein [Desulfonema limicola]